MQLCSIYTATPPTTFKKSAPMEWIEETDRGAAAVLVSSRKPDRDYTAEPKKMYDATRRRRCPIDPMISSTSSQCRVHTLHLL